MVPRFKIRNIFIHSFIYRASLFIFFGASYKELIKVDGCGCQMSVIWWISTLYDWWMKRYYEPKSIFLKCLFQNGTKFKRSANFHRQLLKRSITLVLTSNTRNRRRWHKCGNDGLIAFRVIAFPNQCLFLKTISFTYYKFL